MTADPLLHAVLADPGNDLPRLIYADALDDRGEAEQAEFIRVQCELARPHPGCHCKGCRPNERHGPTQCRQPLRGRERELWDARRTGWFGRQGENGLWHYLAADHRSPARVSVVRRGFVDEIRLPLAAFVGGACERRTCHGGRVMLNAMASRRCPACHGTGTVLGCAAELFRAHPITRVVLTDREPLDDHDRYGWIDSSVRPTSLGDPERLTLELWRLIGGHRRYTGEPVLIKWFDAAAAALAALSAACVAYGRTLAGLPPLPTRTPGIVSVALRVMDQTGV